MKDKNNDKLIIQQHEKEVEYITLYNSGFLQICEFIVSNVALPLVTQFLYDFLKSRKEENDRIKLKFTIDNENEDNISIEYSGSVEDFKKLMDETTNFEDLKKLKMRNK